MKTPLVHSVGRSDHDPNYYAAWKAAIERGIDAAGSPVPVAFVEFHCDDILKRHDSGPDRSSCGLVTFGDSVRWTVGMFAQFTVESGLRRELRDRLATTIDAEALDLIAAHSPGTLLTFEQSTKRSVQSLIILGCDQTPQIVAPSKVLASPTSVRLAPAPKLARGK